MSNLIFGKTMKNVRKHRDIKFVTTEKTRKYFVSEPLQCYLQYFFFIKTVFIFYKMKNKQTNKQTKEPNYHTTTFFTKNFFSYRKQKNSDTHS